MILELVEHVERDHHPNVHIDQLGCQVKVTLQIRRVDYIDYDIRLRLVQVLAYIELFWCVGGKGIGSRQVDNAKRVTVLMENALFGVYGYATVVPDVLVCSRGKIKQGGFATIGVADQGDIDCFSFMEGDFSPVIIRGGDIRAGVSLFFINLGLVFFLEFSLTDHLDHVCVLATK